MNPVFNLEPKYRVTILTIEEWTRGPGTPLAVEGISGLRIGPGLRSGRGLGSTGNLQTEGSACL